MKDRLGEPEGGSEWEPIKILLEGDGNSNKTNTASETLLRLNYPSWPRPRSHWSATGPRNQQLNQPNQTPQTHSEKLSSLLSVPHRSDRWLLPVRPMAPVRPVDSAGQAGGEQQMHSKVPGSLSDSSRPWNKNHLRNTTWKEEEPLTKPSKTTPNTPRTDQQDHGTKPHGQGSSPRQIPLRARTGQTGQEHWSDRSRLGSSG